MNRSGCIRLFVLLLTCPMSVNAELCPKSPIAAVNEYYSAVRRVDLSTLETLSGGTDWIHRDQIEAMSRRLDTFEILSTKQGVARTAKGPQSAVHIRVRERWKNPHSQSFGYFTTVTIKGCWRLEDFGVEE